MAIENPWELIDKTCDDYLSQWSKSSVNSIPARLENLDTDVGLDMAIELLLVDIECCSKAGESPQPERYHGVAPAAAIEEAFRRTNEESGQDHPLVVDLLAAWAALDGLRTSCLIDIANRLTWRSYEAGELLLQEHSEAQGLYFILGGVVEIRTSSNDGQRIIDQSGQGAIVGEMSLLTGARCTADVVAIKPVKALVLSHADYQSLREKHEELEVVLGMLVAERLGSRDWDALCGKTLNDYDVQRCLRRGGMGVVYEAVHPQHEQPVALKMLRHSLIHDEQAVKCFEQEGHLLESLNHPNIIAVHEIFAAYGTVFLSMDLCDGDDLTNVLASHGPMNEELARRLLGQVAAGLQYAQSHRVIHCDLKPTNVLIDRDGTAKLCDFGLAEMLDTTSKRSGALAGTPRYMAPEQLSALGVGPECDWYSFGCLGYEMLAGQPLFAEANIVELSSCKANWFPPDVWKFPVPISDELQHLLTHSLHPLPEERRLDLGEIAEWGGACA